MGRVENLPCMVYNASFEPLSIIRSRDALVHLLEGKASIVESHEELAFRTVNTSYPAPTSIVLKEYKKSRPAFRAAAQLTQRNLFIRDKWTCGYCQRRRSELGKKEFLTRDHIHPICRGGKDTWTNVVTACNKCNNKKADYTLEEMNMTLKIQPSVPTVFSIWARNRKNLILNHSTTIDKFKTN